MQSVNVNDRGMCSSESSLKNRLQCIDRGDVGSLDRVSGGDRGAAARQGRGRAAARRAPQCWPARARARPRSSPQP